LWAALHGSDRRDDDGGEDADDGDDREQFDEREGGAGAESE